MKQFVIDSASVCGEKAVIRGKDFHYLVHVRRCRVGSRFLVVDETGRRYEASVTVISPDECVLTLTAVESVPTEEKPAAELILIQCLPKAKKMDLIVRQAVEAAVCRVVPAVSRYCISRPDARAAVEKVRRWQLIAREAIQQSGSAVGTTVDGIVSLETAADKFSDCDCRLFFTICRCRIRSGFMMRFPVRSGLCLLSVRKADSMMVKQRCCRKKAFGRFIWGGTF